MKVFMMTITLCVFGLALFLVSCGKSGDTDKDNTANSPAVKDTEVYTVDSITFEVIKVTMKKGEVFPLTNTVTSEKTLWKAYYCNNCKTIFGEKPGTKIDKCPKCGSTDFNADAVKDHLDAPVWKG